MADPKVELATPSPPLCPRKGASLARWVAYCAVAEGVGMTAAAGAAKVSQAFVGTTVTRADVAVVLALAVGGGLVEGSAIGFAQARGFAGLLAPRLRRRWVAVTVSVAGLGWAAASVPGALAGGQESGTNTAPSWQLLLGGAAVLGALMGGLLGAAQATVLRGRLAHPWRWVAASVAGWMPAMAVIYSGASVPGADWGVLPVLVLGAGTGLAAGSVLGLVTGWFLPSLTGPPAHNRLLLAMLASPAHRLLPSGLAGLRVRGVVTGAEFELPVMAASWAGGLVVLPGRPETKSWWRNLARPASVEVLLEGGWRTADGVVLRAPDAGYRAALDAYLARFPRVAVPEGAPLVTVLTGTGQRSRAPGTTQRAT